MYFDNVNTGKRMHILPCATYAMMCDHVHALYPISDTAKNMAIYMCVNIHVHVHEKEKSCPGCISLPCLIVM